MNSKFFKEKIKRIFNDKKTIIDIGGGLRVSEKQGNRFDKANEWMLPFLDKVEYKIMDPVDTYHPDIVGDIHSMSFQDNSLEAILCLSVLEHVENPILAAQEMYRVLKFDGYCLVHVPFLYYYHAEKGYYGDFWRFTEDSVNFIFKDFSSIEIQQVRGAIETWLKISPLGRSDLLLRAGTFFDRVTGKSKSKQTSGYYVFLVK